MRERKINRTANAEIFFTRGVLTTLDPTQISRLLKEGLKTLNDYPNADFVVFDPEAEQKRTEDEGTTVRLPAKGLYKKIYVKLDDYGNPETLANALGRPTQKRFVITILLPEEW